VPRSIRGRPSGLKAAGAPPAAAALRAGPDPGDLGGPWRQETRARPGPAPAPHGTPPRLAAGYGDHGKGHLPAALQRPPEPAG